MTKEMSIEQRAKELATLLSNALEMMERGGKPSEYENSYGLDEQAIAKALRDAEERGAQKAYLRVLRG